MLREKKRLESSRGILANLPLFDGKYHNTGSFFKKIGDRVKRDQILKNSTIAVQDSSDSESMTNPGMLLLILFLFIKFVPFPVIKSIGFAPENFVVVLMGIYLWFNFSRVAALKGRIVAVLVLMTLFFVLEYLFDFLQGEPFRIPVASLRMVLSMMFIVIVCTTERRLLFAIKLFLVMMVVSVVFGTLLYLFGEPFSSVRAWFVQSTSTATTFIGKGSQLTGIGVQPHVFSYFLAVTPILCYSLFLSERKNIWILYLLILCVGLLLNAERAPLLFNIIVFAVAFWRQRNRLLLLSVLVLSASVVFGAQHLIGNVSSGGSPQRAAVLVTGNLAERMKKSSINEVIDRIKWQMYGIRTVLKHPFSGATKRDYSEAVYEGRVAYISASRSDKTLEPHNHYVNAGIKGGIWGWLILVLLFFQIRAMLKYDFGYTNTGGPIAAVALGIKLSVVAVLGNAVFHNAGIFDAEFATCTILAFLMALYTITSGKKPKESDKTPL